MNTPEEIKKIARLRLREAKLLTENNLLDGAFYLAGYSVELMLKAKTCEHFGVPNLFDENSGDTKDQLSLLFGRWDENCRYLPEGTMTSKKDMAALVKALEETPNGILTWIETS